MTTENHHPITDEDIRLYLCDALSPDRRAEIRRWFGTEEGQRYLSEVIDEDVARILSGEELHSSESIEIQPLHIEIPTEKSKKQLSTDNRMVVAQYRHMDTGHFIISHRRIHVLQPDTISPPGRNICS